MCQASLMDCISDTHSHICTELHSLVLNERDVSDVVFTYTCSQSKVVGGCAMHAMCDTCVVLLYAMTDQNQS